MKDLLFVTGIHGNEKIGPRILRKISQKVEIDYLVANKEAQKKNKRILEVDMNRSFPGKKYSKRYEYKRAYEVYNIAKRYKKIIDIHDTKANSGLFIIIPKTTKVVLDFIKEVPLKNIVIWKSYDKKDLGPLAKFVNCGISIECGPRSSKGTDNKLEKLLLDYINKKNPRVEKEYFEVYDKILRKDISRTHKKKFKDFRQISYNKESFYPILVGEYKDIFCYKAKKVFI